MVNIMKKVLVAVDGSRYSKKAFEYTLDEAKTLGNHITILRIVPSLAYGGDVLEGALKDEIKTAKEFTGELKKEAEERDVDAKAEVTTGTHTATAIVKFADEGNFDLIVVGSRGKTELETISLGSVSEGVIERAHCPVLVVR